MNIAHQVSPAAAVRISRKESPGAFPRAEYQKVQILKTGSKNRLIDCRRTLFSMIRCCFNRSVFPGGPQTRKRVSSQSAMGELYSWKNCCMLDLPGFLHITLLFGFCLNRPEQGGSGCCNHFRNSICRHSGNPEHPRKKPLLSLALEHRLSALGAGFVRLHRRRPLAWPLDVLAFRIAGTPQERPVLALTHEHRLAALRTGLCRFPGPPRRLELSHSRLVPGPRQSRPARSRAAPCGP